MAKYRQISVVLVGNDPKSRPRSISETIATYFEILIDAVHAKNEKKDSYSTYDVSYAIGTSGGSEIGSPIKMSLLSTSGDSVLA
jgi:hypothetical protein